MAGFLKWWISQKNHGVFATKKDQHLGCEMGKPTIEGNTQNFFILEDQSEIIHFRVNPHRCRYLGGGLKMAQNISTTLIFESLEFQWNGYSFISHYKDPVMKQPL